MPDSDGNAMLWFNLVGLGLAALLIGLFFWYFGGEFFGFLSLFVGDEPVWPQ